MTLEEYLEDLLKMEPNWDSYGADPPAPVAVENAKAHAKACEAIPGFRFSPTVDGGVVAFFEGEDRYADLHFNNAGELWATTFDHKNDECKVWEIQSGEVQATLDGFKQFLALTGG